jgi:hypothetical protein
MNDPIDGPIDSIGIASLQGEGTLKLDLHRSFDTRFSFHKILYIHPDNPRYRQYVERLGGINPGERKRIPAAVAPADGGAY